MKKILFICMGNICRSPAAEGVFEHLIRRQGVAGKYGIDSAGTIAAHVGEKADPRMRQAATSRGIELKSISRQVKFPEDYESFDLILAMDQDNFRNLTNLDRNGEFSSKIKMMTDFSVRYRGQSVPDPYYGGEQGFETVLDILEDSCQGLLEQLEGDS